MHANHQNAAVLRLVVLLLLSAGCGDLDQFVGERVAEVVDENPELSAYAASSLGFEGRAPTLDPPTPDVGYSAPDLFEEPDAEPVPPLEFGTVTPARGALDGSTAITIAGQGFSATTKVYFADRLAHLTWVDDTLVGNAPAGESAGPVTIRLVDEDGSIANGNGAFTYFAPMAITDVAPSSAPSIGGIVADVHGAGFDAETRISFGGRTALRHELVDPGLMRVVVPPHPPGEVDVRATGIDASERWASSFEFRAALGLDGVQPPTGDPAGGEEVTLLGSGLDQHVRVFFGQAEASVVSVSDAGHELTVVTPAGTGLVDVRVEGAGGSALAVEAFFFGNEEGLVAVHPRQGPASGGTEARLIGPGIDAPGVLVRIGGAPAGRLDAGPGWVVVRTPPGAVGLADVAVTFPSQRVRVLTDAFRYVRDLWIDRISPSAGSTGGGERLILSGEGLSGVRSVELGGVSPAFQVLNDTTIAVTAPPHPAGSSDVVVERDGIEATLLDGYQWTEPVRLDGFTPARGAVAGGTWVELRGRGFDASTSVAMGETFVREVELLDSQTIAFRTPAGTPGPVDVRIFHGLERRTGDEQFVYFNPASRFGGTWGAPIDGSVNVSVFATNGRPISTAYVMLSTNGQTSYQGFADGRGQITFSGPDVMGEQVVSAAAQGYSAASVQYFDAENLTLYLRPPVRGGGGSRGDSPKATFNGRVTGLNKAATGDPLEVLEARVYATKTSPWRYDPVPTEGQIVKGGDGGYQIETRIGDLALVAVGGVRDLRTGAFEPMLMGVARYLVAGDGEIYEDVDIRLDIPLDQTVRFKLEGVPGPASGVDTFEVRTHLKLGFEGYFGMLSAATGASGLVEATGHPPLTDELADVTYFAHGGAYTRGWTPFSVATRENIADLSDVVPMPPLAPIAVLTSPSAGEVAVDRLIAFDAHGVTVPDFYYARITRNADRVWDVYFPGERSNFVLPQLPDLSGAPPQFRADPYPEGNLRLLLMAIVSPGFSMDEFRWNATNLSQRSSYSSALYSVRLR